MAYPNPFRDEITFEIELFSALETEIKITDITGKTIFTIAPEMLEAGVHKLAWNGNNNFNAPQSDGIYFAHVIMGGEVEIIKIVLQK